VRQKQAALAQAYSKAEAERTLERNQQLANAGAISQELDTRATAVVTAREAVRVAQADVSPKLMSAVTSLAYSNPNPTGTNIAPRWGIWGRKR